jgi:hypothetical protein
VVQVGDSVRAPEVNGRTGTIGEAVADEENAALLLCLRAPATKGEKRHGQPG